MAGDRHRIMIPRPKSHRHIRCTAVWLCGQLLLFGLCQGMDVRLSGFVEGPRPRAPSTGIHHRQQRQWLPGRILGTHAAIQVPRAGLFRDSRRLRSAMADASAESADGRPNPPILPYPREGGAVQCYLNDALDLNAAPYTIPVWFVVVVDPNNVAATNVTLQQLQRQIDLLNKAYMTGLPGSDGIIQESGEYETRSTRITMVPPEGPVVKHTVSLDETMARYKAQGPEKQIQLESGVVVAGEPSGAAAVDRERSATAPDITSTDSIRDVHQASSTVPKQPPIKGHTRPVATRKPLAAQHPQQPIVDSTAGHRQLTAASSSSGNRQLWRFELEGVRYTSSSSPMCVGSSTELTTKRSWRSNLAPKDGTLVIYVSQITHDKCKGVVAGYSVMFGFGTSPFDLLYWKEHKKEYMDGVVIDPGYLVNDKVQASSSSGAQHGASSGAQLIHEVGHWMGLLHTFEGGCTANEAQTDQVDDTPAEANPAKWGVNVLDASSGCSYRDTCRSLAGPDMYYNYMDYMNLACARTFTAGQQARMLYLFRQVRRS